MLQCLADLRSESGLDGEFTLYKTIETFPHRRSALHILRRCAYIVGPIMRRRGWNVVILSELSPDDRCLGKSYFKRIVTKGHAKSSTSGVAQEICLRLRYPDDPGVLIPIDVVMRTVLHELAHFNYRRHFFGFYGFNGKLLAELEEDIERSRLAGVTWEEIPKSIADTVEMRETMVRDLIKSGLSYFKPNKHN